ncbi:FxDxF family PEP-CTERM protein, partial [Rhodoferax sp.]|uniref:FxDxF family PEP-CTERM protein n=1 Tax=Rhodoferax sp. TaxID=50421 RepID=UPI0026098C57
GQFALTHTGQDLYLRYTGDDDKNSQFYLSSMTVAAVPEPETYAMLLAGLGMLGAVARRRKQPQA